MNIRSGFVLLTTVFTARSTELKPETVKAWQDYVQSATARMQERLCEESHFLKVDENQDWVRRVPSGGRAGRRFLQDWSRLCAAYL